MFSTRLPETNKKFREAIYNGEIFHLAPTQETLDLTSNLRKEVTEIYGDDLYSVHSISPHQDLLAQINPLRQKLITEQFYLNFIRGILREFNLEPSKHIFDPLRLRINLPNGHLNKKAAKAYSAHRDTWYSNPESQINWWVPLHDITAEQSFFFYPKYFNHPIKNTSDSFDYNDWNSETNWPHIVEEIQEQGAPFTCKAGELIIFSASHLHQTCPNLSNRTRFSVDFRTVYIDDLNNKTGAPNIDNASAPNAVKNYLESIDA